jgi:hypothetical protein
LTSKDVSVLRLVLKEQKSVNEIRRLKERFDPRTGGENQSEDLKRCGLSSIQMGIHSV